MTCRRLRLRDSRVCGSASDRRSFVRFGFRRTEPACEPLGGRLARPDQSRAGSASRARILEAAQASIRVCVTLPPSSVDLAHSHRQLTPPSHSANSLRQATPPTHSAKPLRQPTPPTHSASPTPPTHSASPTPPTPVRQHQSANTSPPTPVRQHALPSPRLPIQRAPTQVRQVIPRVEAVRNALLLFGTHSPEESYVSECSTREADTANRTPPTALRQPHSASPLRQPAPPAHSAKPETANSKSANPSAPSHYLCGSFLKSRCLLLGSLSSEESYVSECSAREANAANSQRQPAPPTHSANPLRQATPPSPRLPIQRAPTQVRQVIPRVEVVRNAPPPFRNSLTRRELRLRMLDQ